MVNIEHYYHCHAGACPSPTPSVLAELKEILMSIQDTVANLTREVEETKAQGAAVVAALTGLMAVVQPLVDAANAARAALAEAQAALAASEANTTAIEQTLAAAVVGLDDTQTAVQPALDAAAGALP